MAKIAPNVRRMIARCQPLFLEHVETLAARLPDIKAAGAQHILFGEAYSIGKDFKRGYTARMTARRGRYFSYPTKEIEAAFSFLRDECRKIGVPCSFECWHTLNENGDCCGCKGLSSNKTIKHRRKNSMPCTRASKGSVSSGGGAASASRITGVGGSGGRKRPPRRQNAVAAFRERHLAGRRRRR